ncbi:MAG: sulfotransferase family 2 domain-containing protein [Vicinamibacterales bacterium]
MDLRSWMRSVEFGIPPRAARLAFRLSGRRFDPYHPHHDQLRAIFVHIPKTAGTSVTRALFGVRASHVPLSRFLAVDPERYASYFKFAFVRNPWDRMHSAYGYLAERVGRHHNEDGLWASEHLEGVATFEQFIASLDNARRRREVMSWVHFRPQCDWIRIVGRPGVGCDFVGRFEFIDSDFESICRRLGVNVTLPVLRRGRGGSYRDAYSRSMVERVGEWYREDVATFDYRFE